MMSGSPSFYWRLWCLITAGALTSFLMVGCSSGSAVRAKTSDSDVVLTSPDAGTVLAWSDVTSSWSSEGANSSIYSLNFFDKPPDGMFLRVVSYVRPVNDPCQTLRSELSLSKTSTREYWLLLLHLSSYVPAIYQVKPKDVYGPEKTVQILVEHVVDGKKVERHTGLAGTIEVTAAPGTMQEQKDGASFSLRGSVEFSEIESQQKGCAVGGNIDGTGLYQTCHCVGADGSSFTCPSSPGELSCCVDQNAPRRKVDIAIKAVPCADVCVATDFTLTSFCRQLGAQPNGSL